MGYGYFPIRFHIPNVSKCNSNECLFVRTFGSVCELAMQTGSYRSNSSMFLIITSEQ